MIYFGREEGQMLGHMAEVVGDRISNDPDGYTRKDGMVVDKVDVMGKTGPSLIITGAELDPGEAREMYRQVVHAELDNWVPNASQRLICRVARGLGFFGQEPREQDHGNNLGNHALTRSYIAETWVQQCVSCGRLFSEGN